MILITIAEGNFLLIAAGKRESAGGIACGEMIACRQLQQVAANGDTAGKVPGWQQRNPPQITDSIQPTEDANASDRIRILTIAPLIGEAVRRIADESSVSSLFD